MTDYRITLHVSPAVYERAQRIAQQTAQPLERVLAAQLDQAFDDLAGLPSDEQAELSAFRLLADDTLFGIVSEQMPPALDTRLVALGKRISRGQLTPDESAEYAALVERGNRLLLRKAWAANILMDRGHRVAASDFAPGSG